MNHRGRIQAILNRQPVDRMPVDIWHTPEIEAALKRHTGTDCDLEMWKALDLDKIVWIFLDLKTASGENIGSQVGASAAGERTMWGVPLVEVNTGFAVYQEFLYPPMQGYSSPAEVESYAFWPDPDLFDYATAAQRAQMASQDFAVIGPWVSLYELYCQLRGLEQALTDLVDSPVLVEACLDRLEWIQTEAMKRFLDQSASDVDLVFISDDIAGQKNLLLSPAMWRRHLEPRVRRWCDLIHSYGLKVFYHTDGAAERLIGPLIDCGIDVLNPIQHACPGMEMDRLKKNYGADVIFHGGIDNQQVLPFGSPEDVRRETQHCLETLGAGRGGYIVASCHNVQPGTPVENVLEMIRVTKEW